MPSRRALIAMSEDEQREFLESGATLQVASVGPSGWPHLVAMFHVVVDGLIHFTTYRKSQKTLNLRRNPRITVMLESGKVYSELKGLVIEGVAELVEDPEYTARILSLVTGRLPRSTSEEPTPPSVVQIERASKRVTVRVHPKRVYSWDHSKLGRVH